MSKLLFPPVFLFLLLQLRSFAALTLRGAQCGSKRCSLLESCSQYSALCEPCSKICELDSHNHEEQRCERDCQAYLMDQRYLTRSSSNGNDGDIREEVSRLKGQLTATLIVCTLLALVIVAVCLAKFFRCMRDRGLLSKQWFRDRLNLKKKSHYPESPTVMRNPHVQNDTPAVTQKVAPSQSSAGDQLTTQLSTLSASGLKLQMPPAGYQNDSPPPAPSTIASGWSTPGTETSHLATPSIAPGSNNRRHPAEDSVYQARTGYDNKGLNLTPSPDKKETHGF
ncbi:uncharacterized protein LOC113368484 [Ctenocephalides felis]|uniref:uncharacterized protein LOC113368484 n=1 Tax=Ctenocephalides felis TaxID=7515 RepID=UPI000E6E42DD|nr:uncharacterized protein LOC113368484 [Ctenocephalides felis]